jgi:hypothetical protein
MSSKQAWVLGLASLRVCRARAAGIADRWVSRQRPGGPGKLVDLGHLGPRRSPVSASHLVAG